MQEYNARSRSAGWNQSVSLVCPEAEVTEKHLETTLTEEEFAVIRSASLQTPREDKSIKA